RRPAPPTQTNARDGEFVRAVLSWRSAEAGTVGRMDDAKLTRRGSLAGMAGLLLGLAGWKAAGSEGAGPAAVASGAVSCVLTPEQTEGPYYIAGEKYRRNITEGHSGVPLY